MRILLSCALAVALAFGTLGCTQGARTDRAIREWAENTTPRPAVLVAHGAPEDGGPGVGRVGEDEFNAAVTGLGLALVQESIAAADGSDAANTIVAPLSLHAALTMCANGARGDTAAEMLDALGVSGTGLDLTNAWHAEYATWTRVIGGSDGTQARIVNALWPDARLEIEPAFVDVTRRFFGAHLETLDLQDPASAEHVNNWIAEQTGGHIDRLVEHDQARMLLLVSTTYFNAGWQTTFDVAETRDAPFRLTPDDVKTVPLMTRAGDFTYTEEGGVQAVRLGYGTGLYGMWIVLPPESSGADPRSALDSWIAGLDSDGWSMLTESAAQREGSLSLPRFQTRSHIDVADALKQLGVETAFDDVTADFTGIGGTGAGLPLFLDGVSHEVYLDVHEEGTEAAAATAISAAMMGVPEVEPTPFEMIVDRPFLIAIDLEHGPMLFLGAIYDPR